MTSMKTAVFASMAAVATAAAGDVYAGYRMATVRRPRTTPLDVTAVWRFDVPTALQSVANAAARR
jgi:hypothetical protein